MISFMIPLGVQACSLYIMRGKVLLNKEKSGSSLAGGYLYGTMYTVNCTVYSLNCTLYSANFTLYTLSCTLYTVSGILYTESCAVYNENCAVYTTQWLFIWPEPSGGTRLLGTF